MNSKKRLLVFHPYLAPYRVDLYNYLAEQFILKVVLYNDKVEGLAFDKTSVKNRAKFEFVTLSGGITIGPQVITTGLVKVIIDFKPDVIMPHEFGFNLIIAILFKRFYKYKIFATSDDSPLMAENCVGVRKILRQFAINNIDGLICVNPGTIDILKQKFENVKCNFFYFPIIQDEVVLLNKIKDSYHFLELYRKEFDLYNKFIFLFVGRFVPEKCPELLINAFSDVAKLQENVTLVMVGDGPDKEQLIQQVENLELKDKVIFTGKLSVTALLGWFSIGDVLVLPSKFEPFGAVVNEGLVAGCKVIVSENVGSKCLINEPVNGYIFKNEDVNDLVLKMSYCFTKELPIIHTEERKNLMQLLFKDTANKLIEFVSPYR